MSDESAQATVEPTETASRADDYIDIFFSPAKVFARRTGADWVQPFVVLLVATLAVYFIALPASAAVMRVAAANSPNPEQTAAAMERMGGVMRFVLGIVAPIAAAVTVVLLATVLTIVGRLFDIAISFKEGLLAATFARFVTIPQALAITGATILADRNGSLKVPQSQSFGVVRFLDTHSVTPVLVPLLGRLDLFILWQAVIWAIALSVLGKVPRGRAFVAAAIVWVIAALPGMIAKVAFPGAMP